MKKNQDVSLELTIKIYDPVKDTFILRRVAVSREMREDWINYYVSHFYIAEQQGIAIPPHRIVEITWDPKSM